MDIELHFPDHTPEIQEISSELQKKILGLFPAAVITSDEDNIGFGYGAGYKDLVFIISPHARHVNLGIVNGASLEDPDGLMQGTGKVHRHVKLHHVDSVHDPALENLMQSALRAADERHRREP